MKVKCRTKHFECGTQNYISVYCLVFTPKQALSPKCLVLIQHTTHNSIANNGKFAPYNSVSTLNSNEKLLLDDRIFFIIGGFCYVLIIFK